MEEITKKWLDRARYDMQTAVSMWNTRRYLYVAFMCQQSLEKILKAIIIQQGKEAIRTHNLVRLAEEGKVYNLMNQQYQNFLAELTPYAIEARYGDYKKSLSEIINKKMAQQYLNTARDIFGWLKKKLKLIG